MCRLHQGKCFLPKHNHTMWHKTAGRLPLAAAAPAMNACTRALFCHPRAIVGNLLGD